MNPTSHTSQQDDPLARRMAALGVRESDIQESFVRSGGHGGQHVNKTSTCVVLTHLPTGLRVKCQVSRHQGLNRELARSVLLDKIESARRARLEAERQRVERARRQKRGRSRAAKARMLHDKSKQAFKKALRKSVSSD